MIKPDGYDATAPVYFGDYEKLPPGGYVCKIIDAVSTTSKNGRNMLVLYIDIAQGDFKGFYAKQAGDAASGAELREKWRGIYRRVTDGNSVGMFKGLITSIEESNAGFTFDFDEKKLKGKLVGLIFGEEEYFNTSKGENAISCKPLYPRSKQKILDGDYKTPELKRSSASPTSAHSGNGSANNPSLDKGFFAMDGDEDDEDLPF